MKTYPPLKSVLGLALAGGLLMPLAAARAVAPEPENAAVAWGEPRDGLQAGFYFQTGKSAYRVGERVAFHLMLRNVGKEPRELPLRKLNYWAASLSDGNAIRLSPIPGETEKIILGPGEERAVPGDAGTYLIQAWDGAGVANESLFRLPPGKYPVDAPSGLWVADKDQANTSTGLRARPGKLALEVLPADDAGKGPMEHPASVRDRAKAAWGKPINGLQTGLRYTGDQRQFRSGDTVEMELLVHNVTDRPLSFSSWAFKDGWYGNTPAVYDEKGEYQRVQQVFTTGLIPLLPRTLQPGETFSVGRPSFVVRSPKDPGEPSLTAALVAAPGKYRITQYHSLRPDGARSFDLLLATTPLDLEIVDDAP